MEAIKFQISLPEKSALALKDLAIKEHRQVKDQAAWIIENDLERRGMLPIAPQPEQVDRAVEAEKSALSFQQEG
jgi:hypothetical protein